MAALSSCHCFDPKPRGNCILLCVHTWPCGSNFLNLGDAHGPLGEEEIESLPAKVGGELQASIDWPINQSCSPILCLTLRQPGAPGRTKPCPAALGCGNPKAPLVPKATPGFVQTDKELAAGHGTWLKRPKKSWSEALLVSRAPDSSGCQCQTHRLTCPCSGRGKRVGVLTAVGIPQSPHVTLNYFSVLDDTGFAWTEVETL